MSSSTKVLPRLLLGAALSLPLGGCAERAASAPSPHSSAPYTLVPVSVGGQGLTLQNGTTPLQGETWTSATTGYGPVELDRSNGEAARGDGRTLTLQGKTYPRGYGVHAASTLRFGVGGACTGFTADIGIDDEVGDRGSVVFAVVADGVTLHDSGVMTGRSAARTVNVNIAGKQTLELRVRDSGDGDYYDHADWANPTLTGCTAGAGVPSGLTPEQFGARGDGVTDDTAALNRLFQAVNTEAKPATFGPNKTYRFRRTTNNQFNITRDGAVVYGNGATLKVMDGEPTNMVHFIVRVAGPNITVQDLTVDANKGARPLTPNGPTQTAWFIDGGSRNVKLVRVRGLNAPVDGLYIRDLARTMPTTDAGRYPTDIRLENVEMRNAGRNALSIISSRGVTVAGGKFSGTRGYGDGPWAGIDIEPNGGADLAGNDGVTIEGAETSDNAGAGIAIAQRDNRNITIRNHDAHRNGTALFVHPSGNVTVDGLRATGYGTLSKAGVIAVVPSDTPGATLKFSNLEVSNASDTRPTFFQNYTGTVSLNGLRATNVASKPVLGTWKPTAVSNVYVDGVQIK